jgi:hypothetical protein
MLGEAAAAPESLRSSLGRPRLRLGCFGANSSPTAGASPSFSRSEDDDKEGRDAGTGMSFLQKGDVEETLVLGVTGVPMSNAGTVSKIEA